MCVWDFLHKTKATVSFFFLFQVEKWNTFSKCQQEPTPARLPLFHFDCKALMDDPSDLKKGIPLSSQSWNWILKLNKVHIIVHINISFSYFLKHIFRQCTGQSKSLGCICRKQLIQHLTMIHDSSYFFFLGTWRKNSVHTTRLSFFLTFNFESREGRGNFIYQAWFSKLKYFNTMKKKKRTKQKPAR